MNAPPAGALRTRSQPLDVQMQAREEAADPSIGRPVHLAAKRDLTAADMRHEQPVASGDLPRRRDRAGDRPAELRQIVDQRLLPGGGGGDAGRIDVAAKDVDIPARPHAPVHIGPRLNPPDRVRFNAEGADDFGEGHRR